MTQRPYDMQQAQDFVRDALARSKERHELWRLLEAIYATGSVDKARSVVSEPGKLNLFKIESRATVNMLLPHISLIEETVVARDPRLLATPYGGGELAEVSAAVAEAVIAYFWLRSRATKDLRKATQDLVRLGNGFIKVGWRFAESEVDLDEIEVEEQLGDLLEADAQIAELTGGELSDEEDLVGQLQLTTTLVEANEPWVERASPYDVFVSPEADEMESARWVAHRITLPLDEIESHDQFRNVDVKPDQAPGVGNSGTVEQTWAEWRRQAEDKKGVAANPAAWETATVWEFYDMRSRKMLVFQLDAEEPLYGTKKGEVWVGGEMPYSHRYPPFVHLRGYQASGSDFWGFGDLEAVAHIQELLNEFIREQIANARRAGNKYFVREDAYDVKMADALESDEPDVVAVVNTDLPLSEVIYSVERKALSGDVYAAKEEMEEYLRKILGINDFQAGGVGADRMSATAAAVVDSIASLRAQGKIATVEEAAAQVGNLMLLLCQQYLDQPTPVRVAGQNGAIWQQVETRDIQGEFLVKIEGGSTQRVNPAAREEKGRTTLTQIAPMLVELGYDPTPAIRSGLRDMGYDPDVLLAAPQQPPPGTPQAPEGGGPLPQDAPAAAPVEAGGPPDALAAQAAGGLAL